jgi:hypothetical protein
LCHHLIYRAQLGLKIKAPYAPVAPKTNTPNERKTVLRALSGTRAGLRATFSPQRGQKSGKSIKPAPQLGQVCGVGCGSGAWFSIS